MDGHCVDLISKGIKTRVPVREETGSNTSHVKRFLNDSVTGSGNAEMKCDPGRWVGRGFQGDNILLTADRGYLLWMNPKGNIEVVFRYGNSKQDFCCYIDPQYMGVKIFVDKNGVRKQVVDGVEDPRNSYSKFHKRSPFRNKPENNFELTSFKGEIKLTLEALKNPKQAVRSFKINYVMAL